MARTLAVEIVGDATGFTKALDKAAGRTKRFAGAARVAGVAIGGALVVGMKKSVDAALDAERAEVRLNQAFQSVRASAKQRAAAQEAVSKVSRRAALDDEDLSDVLGRITRSTGSVGKGMKGMALAADIARARNVSLEQAAKGVEKVMLGNEKGLSRLGIQLGKNATASDVLAEAQKQFGGAAEKYGDSAAGAQDRYRVAIENLQESLGKGLLPAITVVANKVSELVGFFEKHQTLAKVLAVAIGVLAAAMIVASVAATLLNLALLANPVGVVILAIVAFGVAIVVAWKKSETFREIVTGVFDAVKKVVLTFLTIWLTIIDKWLGGLQLMAEAASKLPFVGDQFKGLADKIGDARDKVQALQGKINDLKGKKITITVDIVGMGALQAAAQILANVTKKVQRAGQRVEERAHGGPVSAMTPYLVGERGPELFVPRSGGTIIPNGAGGRPFQVNLSLDGKTLAAVLIDPLRGEIKKVQRAGGTF